MNFKAFISKVSAGLSFYKGGTECFYILKKEQDYIYLR